MVHKIFLMIFAVAWFAVKAHADLLTYTSEDRHAQVTLDQQFQRADAMNFLPFSANIDLQDVVSHGIARQDSVLTPTGVEGHCYALAHGHGLLSNARTDNRLLVEFNVSVATPFILAGHFQSRDNGTSLPFASFRFSGPNGDIFNLVAQPVDNFDFAGQNAYTGILTPGHYAIDGNLHPVVFVGTSNRDATLDFTLVVPSPAPSLVLLAGFVTLRRRRPEVR